MTKFFVHRPDGRVVLSDGSANFIAPLDWFSSQEPDYDASGVAERHYYPGDRHYALGLDGQTIDAPLPWQEGDGYIARIATYRAAWDAEQPPPEDPVDNPEPTLSELDQAKVDKLDRLHFECQSNLKDGFTSVALGTPHRYSSDTEDQINLIGAAVAAGIGTPIDYVCTDVDTGIQQSRTHTPAQMLQVYSDGLQVKQQYISCFHSLRAQVEAATTVAEVEAIAWACPMS